LLAACFLSFSVGEPKVAEFHRNGEDVEENVRLIGFQQKEGNKW
jgi:hypothetical protein